MTSSDFTMQFLVNESPIELFKAINNGIAWWQGEITGNSQKLHDEFIYRMEDFHYSKQKLVELIPNEKVVWLVTDSRLSFT